MSNYKYYTKNMDSSPPDFIYSSPSYIYRDSRDVSVVDTDELVGKYIGLLDNKGYRIFREPNQIGFGRD